MNGSRLPPMGRKIFSADSGNIPMDDHGLPDSMPSAQSPAIENPGREKSRVLKRLLAIIGEHSISAERVGIRLSPEDLKLVFEALRTHARKGEAPDFPSDDEIRRYALDILYAELVEEPSNVLYTTRTGPDTMRYDAMTPDFWIECIDILERTLSP